MYKSILFHVIGTKICFEKNNSILQSSLVHMKHGDQGFSDLNRCVWCFCEWWLQSGFSDYLMWHNSIKESREKPLRFRQSPLLDSVGTTNKYIACWKMIKPQNVSLASGISLHPCRISSWDKRDNISPIITWAAVLFHACWEREGWGLSHFLEHAELSWIAQWEGVFLEVFLHNCTFLLGKK